MKLDMPHAAAGGACSLTTRRCRLLPLHARPYGRPTPAPTHRTSRRRPQSRRTAAAAPRRAAPPSCAPQQQCRSLHGQGKAGRKRGEPQAVKGSVRAPEQCKHPRLQAQRPPLAVNPPRTQPSSLRAPPPPPPTPFLPSPSRTVGLCILAQQRQVGSQVCGGHRVSTQLAEGQPRQAAPRRQVQAAPPRPPLRVLLKQLGEDDAGVPDCGDGEGGREGAWRRWGGGEQGKGGQLGGRGDGAASP